MTLDEIDEGAAVFVDANIFVYHFVGTSAQCTRLLQRSATGEIRGATSIVALAEVCHRLMMVEAVKRNLVTAGNVARRLQTRPEIVKQLVTYRADIESISAMRIDIADMTEIILMEALGLQRRYGLLTNDSMILATMLRSNFRLLATADRRLSHLAEIDTASPTDLNN